MGRITLNQSVQANFEKPTGPGRCAKKGKGFCTAVGEWGEYCRRQLWDTTDKFLAVQSTLGMEANTADAAHLYEFVSNTSHGRPQLHNLIAE
jgi:hypothetical protein